MRFIVLALATLVHLAPRPFGVSPVGAMALYAGAFGRSRLFWAVPMLPLAVAAALFGRYDPIVMLFVFAGFALASFAGRRFLSTDRTIRDYGCAIGTGALIFYVISNIGNWYAFYPHTPAALVDCYINGLPFLFQAILADAAFCYLLFGVHRLLARFDKSPVVA